MLMFDSCVTHGVYVCPREYIVSSWKPCLLGMQMHVHMFPVTGCLNSPGLHLYHNGRPFEQQV